MMTNESTLGLYLTLSIACENCGSDIKGILTTEAPSESEIKQCYNGTCAINRTILVEINKPFKD